MEWWSDGHFGARAVAGEVVSPSRYMIQAGIDAGSRATKVVLFDTEQARVVGSGLADQGVEQQRLASELLDRTCRGHGQGQ